MGGRMEEKEGSRGTGLRGGKGRCGGIGSAKSGAGGGQEAQKQGAGGGTRSAGITALVEEKGAQGQRRWWRNTRRGGSPRGDQVTVGAVLLYIGVAWLLPRKSTIKSLRAYK
ncbi:hypothetical protein MAPG_07080 [Magnaporthiopsis poae ATCC 64411]|uniref:Uncharacterized protein n=1 Tax=Magnaporthiopsis poae (strain ATCC 64411 / 73-15) TaxID=644358 RepID=A0A0C4E3R3_MAGP6|nr:hypothetical protein MAPG_07080 [Magnaporthiopsis poae ATCC 64411]